MIAYFDCFSGVSGDMLLGALVDAGVPVSRLKKELSRLPVKGYKLSAGTVKRAGLAATRVDIRTQNLPTGQAGPEPRTQKKAGRKWKDIERIIKRSTLSKDIKQKGLAVFERLFKAEAHVHGERYDKVHLHELGAVDCIVDIFGTLICLDVLGIQHVYSSPVNLGAGSVKTEHGTLPVPAPATAELLKNIPVYSSGKKYELTTPTGAVLISELAEKFGAIPEMSVAGIGMGAGNKNFKNAPNVLRVFLSQSTEHRAQNTDKSITVIETNIDDMNPQVYEYVMERLFRAGALDVFLTQVIMKKTRPGIKLTVFCDNDKRDAMIKIILSETTSIGLRFYEVWRRVLDRQVGSVNTKFGRIKVKISKLGDDVVKTTPEYEDCKKIAKKLKVPLIDVLKEAARSPEKSGSPLRYYK